MAGHLRGLVAGGTGWWLLSAPKPPTYVQYSQLDTGHLAIEIPAAKPPATQLQKIILKVYFPRCEERSNIGHSVRDRRGRF